MKKNEKPTFADWFSAELEKSGVKLSDVSRKTGITPGYLSMLRTGQRTKPRPKTVQQIARALDAPVVEACEAAEVTGPIESDAQIELVLSIKRGSLDDEFEVSIGRPSDGKSLKTRTIGAGESQIVRVPDLARMLGIAIDDESQQLTLRVPLRESN